MRFEELDKKHQEFLMYCLSDHIKSKFKREERDQVIEPNYEEYKAFFNEFDEEQTQKTTLAYRGKTRGQQDKGTGTLSFIFILWYNASNVLNLINYWG